VIFEDIVLHCVECGKDFVFTAGEQSFYSERGLLNEPRRCPDCRARRKQEREQGVEYPILCAECGAEATVPFIPREDRPVFCADCYRNRRNQRNSES
jgi:CxxC-x17-CxxC domain-containing protein